jgi:hypothetical protein
MRTSLMARLRMLVMLAGLLAFCAPLWSDVRILSGASATQRICYCDCDAMAGATICMHMCEIPKYENRSWANSCHKKPDSEPVQPSSAPGAHSTKDNRVQQARQ